MSGLEVAGVALAVVPILLSAAEHYDDVQRPLARLFKFSREVSRYCKRLKTHSTIFREECRLLLGHVVRDEEVIQMLKASSHPLWKDGVVERGLVELLSTSREACMNTIGMVKKVLEEIEHEVGELCEIASKNREEEDSKSWHRRLRKRISFSLSGQLDKSLSQLRDLNEDFRSLTDQVSRLEERRPRRSTVRTRQQSQDLNRFRLVQKASNLLYESLGSACTKHTEHLAHFCLEADLSDEFSPRVRFEISFLSLAVTGSAAIQDPIWFAVESIIKESLARNPAGVCETLTDLSNSLKRHAPPSLQLPHAKKAKSTKATTSPPRSPRCLSPPPMPTLPNLCMHRNFCNQMQLLLSQAFVKNSPLVGLLEERTECRHTVHLSSSAPELKDKPVSLAKVFASRSGQRFPGGIPIYQRLRLARLLAIAVLQFHATPWLKGSWRSEDVLFFGLNLGSSDMRPLLTSPYMEVSVKGLADSLSQTSPFPARTLAPNPFLFGLGVIFIELAYEAPLHQLQRPVDLENGRPDQFTEFFVAKRLSRSASSQMGPRYNNIIRKCLQCDFDCGDDLSQPDLQEGFYRKVVCELGTLEEEFQLMQLGD